MIQAAPLIFSSGLFLFLFAGFMLIFSSAAFSAQSSMDKYTMSDKSRPPSYMGWS